MAGSRQKYKCVFIDETGASSSTSADDDYIAREINNMDLVQQEPPVSEQVAVCSDSESSVGSDHRVALSSDSELILSSDYQSDSSDDSDDDGLLANLDTLLQTKTSVFLFRNGNLEPLTFVLQLNDLSVELKLKELIVRGGGLVYSKIKDMDIFSIVIVKDNAVSTTHVGPAFKLQYLLKCIAKNKIVSINRYLKTFDNAPAIHKFDYMKVVYYKKLGWNEVPRHVLLNKKTNQFENSGRDDYNNEQLTRSSNPVMLADRSSDENDNSAGKQSSPVKNKTFSQKKTVDKHTRMLYSSEEDSRIVRYIANVDGYESIRGNMLWKNMEKSNICPKRTWQSMKERFMKKIIYNTNVYTFLTDKQKRRFQKLLLH